MRGESGASLQENSKKSASKRRECPKAMQESFRKTASTQCESLRKAKERPQGSAKRQGSIKKMQERHKVAARGQQATKLGGRAREQCVVKGDFPSPFCR